MFVAVVLAVALSQEPALSPAEGAVPSKVDPLPAAPETPEQHISTLTSRIAELNTQIRLIDTDYPVGAAIAIYTGYTLLPFGALGIPLLLLGMSIPGILTAGIVLTVIGVAGVGLLVLGLVLGNSVAGPMREQKQHLTEERLKLEDELRQYRRNLSPSGQGVQVDCNFPILALNF